MKLLITGAGGLLGQDLQVALADRHELILTGRRMPIALDITHPQQVKQVFEQYQPQGVIHCAAMTHVDGCEHDPETAYRVNAHGASLIASACLDHQAFCLYVSTDFVFDGAAKRPYHEYDLPQPLNTYGRSKWQGEQAVQTLCPRHYIVRTAWLYGHHGTSFPKMVLDVANKGLPLRVVRDQVGSPTWTWDLAEAIGRLIETNAYGTYHVVNHGSMSRYEFARALLEETGLTTDLQPIASAEWSSPTRRPVFSTLESLRWTALGLPPLRSWRDALRAWITQMPDY
ncbi:MAG: dTDP-4-dehydrorhamnose reductase [Fimbriimonadia bacterium]|nr:dTDP-4-dehydrorhamnose reductase [Fimbriimonadia bacterium]